MEELIRCSGVFDGALGRLAIRRLAVPFVFFAVTYPTLTSWRVISSKDLSLVVGSSTLSSSNGSNGTLIHDVRSVLK